MRVVTSFSSQSKNEQLIGVIKVLYVFIFKEIDYKSVSRKILTKNLSLHQPIPLFILVL
jgi:hypothetical protein